MICEVCEICEVFRQGGQPANLRFRRVAVLKNTLGRPRAWLKHFAHFAHFAFQPWLRAAASRTEATGFRRGVAFGTGSRGAARVLIPRNGRTAEMSRQLAKNPENPPPVDHSPPVTELSQALATATAARESAGVVEVEGRSPFKGMSGPDHHQFNMVLFRRVIDTMQGSQKTEGDSIAAASAALAAFKPTDEIEGMIAAQAVAMHHGAMECFRRALLTDQPAEIAAKLRKDGANLSRAMTDMLDALDRKRGKGPQVVRVERVVVHEGGQAVVGNVQAGGGGG